MVEVEHNSVGCRFVLRPNRSMSWRGSLIFFLSLCILSSSIATGMAVRGYWLVLPFAGLELLAVGAALYVVALRCHQREVISIAGDLIRIERGVRYPRRCWTLARIWAQVVLEPAARDSSRLLVRSHGRCVEIGRFLGEDERRRLAVELTRSL